MVAAIAHQGGCRLARPSGPVALPHVVVSRTSRARAVRTQLYRALIAQQLGASVHSRAKWRPTGERISRATAKRAFNFNSPLALMAAQKRYRLAGAKELAKCTDLAPNALARARSPLHWPAIVAPHLLSTPNGTRVRLRSPAGHSSAGHQTRADYDVLRGERHRPIAGRRHGAIPQANTLGRI